MSPEDYYVTYDDMIKNFPDADNIAEGNRIEYFHGEGLFYVYNAMDDKYMYDGYNIDWYYILNQID